MGLLIKIFFFLVITIKVSKCLNICPQILLVSQLECDCRNSYNSKGLIIKCEITASTLNSTLESFIQVKFSVNAQIDSLSIKNQHLNNLNQQIIDTSLVKKLSLKNDSIESISSPAFANLVNLAELVISENPIKSIDFKIFKNLGNLDILNLVGNNLVSIDTEVGKSLSVRKLYLSQNSFVELDFDFRDFSNLELISFYNNTIKTLSTKVFSNLTHLTNLNLNQNKLTEIQTNAFADLANLQELYLDHNNLTIIDDSLLSGLTRLSVVTFDNNKLTDIKSNAFVSLDIKKLDLSGQIIKSIESDAIKDCIHLNNIYLDYNLIKRLPPGFLNNLTSLNQLDLNDNFIDELVYDNFGQLDNLNKLNLFNNRIRSIQLGAFIHLGFLTYLDLHTNFIEELNAEIFSGLENLKELILNNNKLVVIKLGTFKYLTNLIYLDLIDNHIEDIEPFAFIQQLTQLTELDFSYNNNGTEMTANILSKISNFDNGSSIVAKTFENWPKLLSLNLKNNKISKIEANAFAGLVNLQELILDQNYLEIVDSYILAGLRNLKNINLENNQLTYIKSNSFVSINIKELDLRNQKIGYIESEAIRACDYLKSLDISKNRLPRITPGFISNLPVLHSISLFDNSINGLEFNTFGRLDNLTSLYLYENYIIKIQPGAFIYLNSLKLLELSSNYIEEINAEMFSGLGTLETLYLHDNKINFISSDAFKNLTNLDYIQLENNYITTIQPFTFYGLIRLEKLYLNRNRLVKISKNSFVSMERLSILELSSNLLNSLDPGIFNGLNALNELYLSDNKLSSIDDIFENLTRLSILGLGSNQLHDIDSRAFAGIEWLQQIDFSNNPLDKYVGKNLFDKFNSSIQGLILNNIDVNPSEFFDFSVFEQLKTLDVSQTKFRIEEHTFEDISISIKILRLRQIADFNLSFLPIHTFTELKELDFSDNFLDWSIFDLSNESDTLFHFHPLLEEVYLSNTTLNDLRYLGLSNLDNLRSLDLSNNLIETIEVDIFNFDCSGLTLKCFKQLNLRNNHIKSIQSDSFTNINDLFIFYIDGNLIEDKFQLNNIDFSSFYYLLELDISNSKLTELPLFDLQLNPQRDAYGLADLRLSHNQIESISAIYFKYLNALKTLDLSYNRISRVDSTNIFSSSLYLEYLNLSSNLIDSKGLSDINFNQCINLIQLNLSYNHVNILGEFLFKKLKKLKVLDVSYNELFHIEANTFSGLFKLRDLFMYEIRPNKSVTLINENFISECNFLKSVHISSIDLVTSNLHAFISSLKATSTNKTVNEADYYNSINIQMSNYNYYKSKIKDSCELTILLLNNRIHLNLFDDFDFDIFLQNCFSLDFYSEF